MLSMITLGDAGVIALLGYAVVFVGITVLMFVVMLVSKLVLSAQKKQPSPAPAASVPVSPPASSLPEAPGAAGKLKLYGTDPKTAAMLMAIVADQLGKPVNELRFISIKEVK